MNTTRLQLTGALNALGLPVLLWTGADTHRQRTAMGLAKTHTLDAGNPYRPCLGKPLERLQDAS
ncbi:hypothetical protein [Streptomyces sp. NPDC052610]|uniref:hypothetical protein n=1 Tax=Streptomyces sp. NPDC052610 TaxID=3154952 RepID=UPI00343FA043